MVGAQITGPDLGRMTGRGLKRGGVVVSVLASAANRAKSQWLGAALIPGFAVVAVLMLVIPVPSAVLDLFLLANIALSVGVLVLTLSVQRPLELSAFPTLLLFVTLVRLALEVTATRLILTQGSAGGVIQAFGSLVVGGNLIIGLVIFLILVVIQFLVITSGTERVSQVAARFTLEATPVRQMAVDQELMAGRINEAEADRRRKEISGLADFYGSMDGATKFIRGDAVAGILIVAINLIGGLVVGLAQQHLSFGVAAQTYSILSVGEGLTTQIPALLISTATGFLVTQAGGSEVAAAPRLLAQLTQQPRVLFLVAGVLVLMALLGMSPVIPLGMAAASALVGWRLRQRQDAALQSADQEQQAQQASQAHSPERLLGRVQVEPLALIVGAGLIGVTTGSVGQSLQERMHQLRETLLTEHGFLLPPLHVHDDPQLSPWDFRILVRGGTVATGTARPDRLLAVGGDLRDMTDIVPTIDPVFGTPAAWILPTAQKRAELAGATVIDAPTILITALAEVARRHAGDLLSREAVRQMVEQARAQHPTVVAELLPDTLSLGEIRQVLQQLLREQVSIRDLPTILEALADQVRVRRDVPGLVEAARHALGRSLVEPYVRQGRLTALVLDPATEQTLHRLLMSADPAGPPPVLPDRAQQLWASVQTALETAGVQGTKPVLLCGAGVRSALRQLVERPFPRLPVIAYTECPPDLAVDTAALVAAALD